MPTVIWVKEDSVRLLYVYIAAKSGDAQSVLANATEAELVEMFKNNSICNLRLDVGNVEFDSFPHSPTDAEKYKTQVATFEEAVKLALDFSCASYVYRGEKKWEKYIKRRDDGFVFDSTFTSR